ncbi:MAG: hypothetical protein HDR88_10525 [Bacteroides sp.]|nr:hypothetical protein [Bacteroides sp.]
MTEARIPIKEIRSALKCDVALGHITQETADHVTKLLNLDWKEEEHQKRKDMDCFLDDLHELFERYDIIFYFEGSYNGTIMFNNKPGRFCFGDRGWFDKDFISLLPKMWKRTQMFNKLNIPSTTHIDEIRPICDAIRRVDRKNFSHYVTDKKFKEMIAPYK